MWYFTWILGTGLACCLAILNGLWFEFRANKQKRAMDDAAEKLLK